MDEVIRLCGSEGLVTTPAELDRLGSASGDIEVSVGALTLKRWNKLRGSRSAARIERALAELERPTHHSYLVEKLNFLFPDQSPFIAATVCAKMRRHPEVFISLGRGMYGLRNWGLTKPPFVRDFVVEALRSVGLSH